MIYSIGMSFGLLVRRTDFTSQCVIFSCGLISAGMYILVYYGLSNKNEAHLKENVMMGDMNSKSKMFCNVDDKNIDNPLEHIINTGRMSSIAV